jgi:cell division topological specificity factor
MNFFNKLFGRDLNSAQKAKERLQIVVTHQRVNTDPDFMQSLNKEIVAVLGKYFKINEQAINIQMQKNQNRSTLELNVTLPN